jgi:quercetin dioxygenase-like cupin family protein
MATVVDPEKIDGKPISESGASGLTQKVIFASSPGRRLHCNIGINAPGGKSKAHSHSWEQVNYVISGSGFYHNGVDPDIPIKAGTVIHVASNELHWYENTGREDLVTIGVLGPMPE